MCRSINATVELLFSSASVQPSAECLREVYGYARKVVEIDQTRRRNSIEHAPWPFADASAGAYMSGPQLVWTAQPRGEMLTGDGKG